MMKRRMKFIGCILAISLLLSMNCTVFASGEPFHFTVYKNQGTQSSAIVRKQDNEACSYVTVQTVMWSTRDPWVFGARVRQSDGTPLTGYYTTRYIGAMGNPGLPFLAGTSAYSGQACVLRAQVDSSSAATIITATGQWLP